MNLNTYLQQLDLAKLDLQPLNDHYIAEQLNEQEKELYLTMISSFVLLDDLTESRTRLFQLYLHACKTQHQQGKIFNLAQNISKEQIKEFVQLCKDKLLIESFFVDVFVFSRLDKPITDKLNELFNNWINLLDVKNDVIEMVIYFVSNIFGIKCDYQLNYVFNVDKLNVWIPYCLEKFNINLYKNNRAYYVDKNQDMNFDPKIENNIFVFEQGIKFKFSDCENLTIKSSNFRNALFEIEKTSKMLVEDSSFTGLYDIAKQYNLFKIDESIYWGGGETENIIFRNNVFEVSKCRVLYLQQSATVEDCIFKNCGNPNLIGGAIHTSSKIKLINSSFDSCIAKVAGALYCETLDYKNGIKKCKFDTCLSLDFQKVNFSNQWNDDWKSKKDNYSGKLNASAVWVNCGSAPTEGIYDSTFNTSNVYIKTSSHSSRAHLVYRTKFIDSILSIGDSDQDILNDCSFEKGKYRLDSNIYQSAGELKVNI